MAYQLYFTVEASKQGKLKGEIATAAHKDKMGGLSFQYAIEAPHDPATGQATGKRHHSAITVVKEWGAATPQLFQALVTNETLPKVIFEFFQISRGTGKEEAFYRVTLENAAVSSIKQYTGAAATEASSSRHSAPGASSNELEAISFTFTKILVEHLLAKTAGADDWKQQS
jgi:type VI secretion system secreted protein Hcp